MLSGNDKVLTLGWAGEAAFTHDGCNWLKRKFKVGETATRHAAAEIWGRTCAARKSRGIFQHGIVYIQLWNFVKCISSH